MAGIMPAGGIPPASATNALNDAPLKAGCDSLWHANRCAPKFDPPSANAMISEVLNVIDLAGLEYDCTLLDNLAKAVSIHEISGNGSATLDGGSAPIDIPNGDGKKLGAGFIDIPNTYHRDIRVFMYADMTIQWSHDSDVDNTSSLVINGYFNEGAAPDWNTQQPNLALRVRADMDSQVINNPFMRVYSIPPGGKRIYWDIRSFKNGPGGWTLPYTGRAVAFRLYGTSAHTRDIFNVGDT